MNWLTTLLQENPKRVPVILLTFIFSVSALSAGGLYVLVQVIESERAYAKMEVTLAKMHYENAEANLQARAKANTEQISRSLDELLPLLKEHTAAVRELKGEFAKRASTEATAFPIYMRLSELDYRVSDLTSRLERERLIAQNVAMPFPFAEPAEVYIRNLLPRIAVFCAIVAAIAAIALVGFLKRKEPNRTR